MSGIFLDDHTGFGGLHGNIGNQPVGVVAEKRIYRGGHRDNILGQQTVKCQGDCIGYTAVTGTYIKLAHIINDLVLHNLFHDIHGGKRRLRFRLRLGLWLRLRYLSGLWFRLRYLSGLWFRLRYLSGLWFRLRYLSGLWFGLQFLFGL